MRRLSLAAPLAAVLSLAACDFEQVIDLDVPPYESQLVVGGFLSPDSVITVDLARSVSVLEPTDLSNTDVAVRDANVAVYDETGQLLAELFHQPASRIGKYVSRDGLRPEPGRTYTLRAEAPGLAPVEATTVIPVPPDFDVRVEDVTTGEFGGRIARIVVTVPDAPGLQTYALLLTQADPNGNGSQFFRGFRSSDPILRDSYSRLDVAVDIDIDVEVDARFFGGQAVFRDVLFDGAPHEFELDVDVAIFGTSESLAIEVALSRLSEEYVRYRQTLALQDETDDNPFAEPVRLASNVDGGLGAFAGYATTVIEITPKN